MRTLLTLLCCLCPLLGQAHELHYTVTQGEAVILHLFHDDTSDFRFKAYEIYREGEGRPYQSGHTGAQGRVALLPDQPGRWRLVAYSEDGHGVDIRFTTDEAARPDAVDSSLYDRHGRTLVGVALILGVFGFFMLFVRRKPAP